MPLAITPTFRPCTHTSDDSCIYQLSLVVATATVSFFASPLASPPWAHHLGGYYCCTLHSGCLGLGVICLPLACLALLFERFLGVYARQNLSCSLTYCPYPFILKLFFLSSELAVYLSSVSLFQCNWVAGVRVASSTMGRHTLFIHFTAVRRGVSRCLLTTELVSVH